MRRFIAFLLALSFLIVSPAQAGYAQLKPPPGWSQGMGAAVPGQAGVFNFGAAANSVSFKGTTVLTNAALNVAGQLVTVPVSMRVAANAATVAAEYSFGNPYLFAAALAAPIAYKWFKDANLEVKDGVWNKVEFGCGPPGSSCVLWTASEATDGWSTSSGGACSSYVARSYPNTSNRSYSGEVRMQGAQTICDVRKTNTGWPAEGETTIISNTGLTSKSIPATDPVFTPVGLPQFSETMAPKPIPDGMPQELPEVEWPLQIPVINPSPAIDPLPAPSPAAVPRPLWIPTGDPVKNPSVEAQPDSWTQPGVRVTPSGTVTDPWRVNITPEDKTKADPTSNVEAEPVVTAPAPSEELSKGLCELFPGILACEKLGTAPAPTDVPNVNTPLTLTRDPGWGPENGTCPQPRSINLTFGTVYMPWDSYCQFANGIRPLVIGLAYLGAALAFIGLGRKS